MGRSRLTQLGHYFRLLRCPLFPPKRRCRVLPPALLYPMIVAAPTRIASLEVPITLEKREAVVTPAVVARNEDVGRRLARYKAALGLIAQHRDKLGAVVGLAAQRLLRDDDRRSRQCKRGEAIGRN